MHEAWRIELLGGLRAIRGDREVARFRTKKTAALLGFLACREGAHARDDLIELLWPRRKLAAARNTLSKALSSLRRQLEPPGVAEGSVLVADRSSVRLAEVTTDVGELRSLLRRAEASGPERLALLERAVGLWKGDLLAGLDEPWVENERERLRGPFARASRDLALELERAGAVDRAIEQLERAAAAAPLDETVHRLLMELLARSGKPLAAVAHYQELVRTLKREVSRLPSEETRSLARRLERLPPTATLPPRRGEREQVPASGTTTFLVMKGEGEEQVLTFARPSEAVAAALAAQEAQEGPTLRAALDTTELEGPGALGRARRLLAAARGGQVLCTEATGALLATRPIDLGRFELDGTTERVFLVPTRWPERPLAAPRVRVPGLPLELSRFFGREAELARIARELAGGTRLLTITGPGGMGKTRLAVEAVRSLVEELKGAALFVPLADVTRPEEIPRAIVEALRLPPEPRQEPLDRAVEELARRRSLLVLDNLEQLVRGGDAVVATLLERAPPLVVLATSRQRLGIEGERELPLEPLAPPDPALGPERLAELASVALFVDRAQAARPDFQVTPGNAPSVAALVRRLEGIPLALSLAGGRAPVMSPRMILERVDEILDLPSRARAGPERHRTLRAAIEWSHELLLPETRQLFRRLSVFRGTFSAAAAAAVCEDARGLEDLRDASLVTIETTGGEPRFRMLETLRAFAREKLEGRELARLEERHARWFADQAGACAEGLADARQPEFLDRVAADLENYRAALAWASDPSRAETALEICASLWRYWTIRGPEDEGLEACRAALSGARRASKARVDVLLGATTLAWRIEDTESARRFGEEALETATRLRDETRVARAHAHLGNVETLAEQLDAARAHHEAALTLARELGDRKLLSVSLGSLGHLLMLQGELEEARPFLEESVANAESYAYGSMLARCWLGQLHVLRGESERARPLLEQSLADSRKLGFAGRALSLLQLGALEERAGRLDAARILYDDALRVAREARLGYDSVLAAASLSRIDPARARSLLEDALATATGERGFQRLSQGVVHRARGDLARREGDTAAARAAYEESLRWLESVGEKEHAAGCLEGLAAIEDDPARAVAFLAQASTSRERRGSRLPPLEQEAVDRVRDEARKKLGAKGFERAWRSVSDGRG